MLIHRWGDPEEYFSEMIHAPSFVAGGPFEPWYVRAEPCPERMVWQLTGADEGPIARAASMLAAGETTGRGIGVDINMGCAAPDIARRGAGVAWMERPIAEVTSLVRATRRAIGDRLRLSVKLRLGPDADYARLLSFARALVGEGAELLTLHPRERREKYARPARWDFVARLAADLDVPVYGNGDALTAKAALDLAARYPCAGIMVGRGAITRPWIFGEIERLGAARAGAPGGASAPAGENTTAGERNSPGEQKPPGIRAAPQPVDRLEVALSFIDALKGAQPPEFWLSRARRYFFYYCDNFRFAHYVKMRAQNANAPDEIGGVLREYLEREPADRFGTTAD